MENVEPIQPELLAAKIEKIQNFELTELLEQFGQEPQLVEALWFLQFVSQPLNYAGGLSRFASDFIASQADHVGTECMAAASVKGGNYECNNAIAIVRELSRDARQALFGDYSEIIENEYIGPTETWDDCLLTAYDDKDVRYVQRPSAKPQRWSRKECSEILLRRLTPKTAKAICIETAQRKLAGYFKRVCEVPQVALRKLTGISRSVQHLLESGPDKPPWYFANVADALLRFMTQRAERIRAQIAQTQVTQLVTEWIDASRHTRKPVMIIGNSRIGKTEAVKMNVAAAPGKCRLVETPDSTALGDLLRRVAESLGLRLEARNKTYELRERIEYVLRFSGIQLIFDESQALLPVAFSRNTAPARLNWVRRALMDRKIPAVLVCTPQYEHAKKRFVKATGYSSVTVSPRHEHFARGQ
jgi:hypothetical protein